MFSGRYSLRHRLLSAEILKDFKRNKSRKKDHWANLRRKDKPHHKALAHFDDFYKSVFGEKMWRSMRLGLLCPNKYCAVINNFGDPEDTMKKLEARGALNIRTLLEMRMYDTDDEEPNTTEQSIEKDQYDMNIEDADSPEEAVYKLQNKIKSFDTNKEDIDFAALYPANAVNIAKMKRNAKQPPQPVYAEKFSLCESLEEAEIDLNRMIYPNEYADSPILYEFIPVTKLKGMENYVSESEYFDYYKKSIDFPINIEDEEQPIRLPGCLNVYTYEKCNISPFPPPTKSATGMLDYYLLDGSSILPVLALDLTPGDRLLDMCAAPGGKSITAIQSLCTDRIRCNDYSKTRFERLNKVMDEYFFSTDKMDLSISVTNENAVNIKEAGMYNKILVDVPCTSDRHSLKSDEDNLFSGQRIKERIRLPEIQAELLSHALKLIPKNGIVVYSTCSLSPVQNDGVIQMALEKLWEETNYQFVVKNLLKSFDSAQNIYFIGKHVGFKYGVVVVPHLTANFGPSYFSKIVRIR